MWTAHYVQISGASGSHADKINGKFEATTETLNGAPVFVGLSDSSCGLWMSDNAMKPNARGGCWWFGHVKGRGQSKGFAYVKDSASPLELPAIWRVAGVADSGYVDQHELKSVGQCKVCC